MTISRDGTVGKGNTNPSYKVDVNCSLNGTTVYRNGVEIVARYLQLSGGTMNGESRSGLVSKAGTDEEIVYLISATSPRPVFGAGSPAQNGPLLQQPGFAGGFCGTSGALRVR